EPVVGSAVSAGLKNALQALLMFMLAGSCRFNQPVGRFALAVGLIQLLAWSIRRFNSKNPVRAECVSPTECPAGMVQSVPPLTPRFKAGQVVTSSMFPQFSWIRTNGPVRFVENWPSTETSPSLLASI